MTRRVHIILLGLVQAWFALGFIVGLAIVPMGIIFGIYYLLTKIQT